MGLWWSIREAWRFSTVGENIAICLALLIPPIAVVHILLHRKKESLKHITFFGIIGCVLMTTVLVFNIRLPYHRAHSTGFFELLTPSQGSAAFLLISFLLAMLFSLLAFKIIEFLRKTKI